ncbi:hypothetical protein BBJ29_005121 [Phytophthora kernoviae]|uniref:Major facilitator superfamily (MFS) profile domain-containing protein n=1 Tax=Phytophthora kernoviae TaxID=325452 RepID=A0A3F2RW96_9STRA|nr:hypothetical protein BBJ29_005121 [Phytophthora kernoviae]RLN64957.1 hypothetical protein BBP00_00003103 [Phytophthora kernoviae]
MVNFATSAVDKPPLVLTKAERRERYMQKTRAEAGYLFKYLILTQIVVYLEAGSIPCLLDQLSVSLSLDATQQGALGGVVYLALSAASPLCAFFLHRYSPKLVLGLSLLCNNVAVLMLALTPTGYAFSANMLILARALVGFTQAFPCIYTPLWVDEYAPREKVAGWMSYLQGSVPMGVMLGYFAGTVSNWLVPESFSLIQTWRWPFLVQFLALLPINVAIFFVPKKHLVIRSDGEREPVGSGASILEEEFIEVYEQGAFSDGVYELLHIPVFCLIVFGLTTVYFVVTGVQYWSTIFMIKSLHASKYLVNGLFVVVSGTGPIFGVFFGGWIIDRYGGYIGVEQRAKALGICMILGLIAFSVSAVTTFFDDVYITSGFLWLLLFFGGAILPACTGIFISVVPAEHRALASSFSVMIFNLFGYALSPYLTGLIMEWVISQQGQLGSYFETCDEACAYRIGFRFCLCWSVWSVLCIGTAWHIASRQADEARQLQHFYSAQRPAIATAEC